MALRLSFLAIVLISQTAVAQKTSKIVKQLKADIGYLASDSLEGRRTGSAGEHKAADYIEATYKKNGILPYKDHYRYPFDFINGKSITESTHINIAGKSMKMKEEAFPLPFSANKKAYSEILPDVMEQNNIWMLPIYTSNDEAQDAHFDWEKSAYERARDAAKHGATGVLFYDSYNAKYPAEFNSKSEYDALEIPVAFLTYNGYTAYVSKTNENNIPVELDINLKKTEMTGTNVAAYIDNKAPYTVVIGAHYDHLGYGEDGNSLLANAKKLHEIHNGADDNASGTAALMQISGWIKKNKLKHYNYLFLNFSGEELGLIGSKAFIKSEKLDSNKIAYMINMDMVGRLNDSTHALNIGGYGTTPAWAKIVDKADPRFKIGFDTSGVGPSDHSSFYYQNIPVLFFFTGSHHDYHKPSDDADKINYEGEAAVMKYVYGIVAKMDKEPKPHFTATKQTTVGKTRFKVTLGIMPDYSFQEGGVRVDGVSDGKPAIRAGIKAGDVITQLGDIKVQSMQSYMEALGKFEPGQKTEVKLMRDGKEMMLPIEFNK
jgi:Zn-dependent M28 family amino/carboxypeptidase